MTTDVHSPELELMIAAEQGNAIPPVNTNEAGTQARQTMLGLPPTSATHPGVKSVEDLPVWPETATRANAEARSHAFGKQH